MAAKRKSKSSHSRPAAERSKPGKKPAGGKRRSAAPPRASNALSVRRTADGTAWELVQPRAARERREDLDEVRKMLDIGEIDVAVDELRWLLGGYSDLIEAHRMLGEVAIDDGDLPLARGHFGQVHQLVMRALKQAGLKEGPLPHRLPANQTFHESGKGLVYCLLMLDKRDLAEEVVGDLLQCDPSDPLAVRALLETAQP